MIIAFFVLLLLGILLFAYYAWKAPAFSESKLDDGYDMNMMLFIKATEDNRFYQHGALDYKRLFGAIGKNLTGGFGSQGASTLTQQVVKTHS